MRGSYSRSYAKDTVESRQFFDVRNLMKGGYLEPGRVTTWTWTQWHGSTNSVATIAEDGYISLLYGQMVERVIIDWTPCHLGGQRPWFRCPGQSCGKRCAKLFYGGGWYLCRICQKLAYQSTRENDTFKAMSRASAIRIKLGGTGSLMVSFPEKPKGMWWRTYEKMANDAHLAASIGFEGMTRQRKILEKILNRIGNR